MRTATHHAYMHERTHTYMHAYVHTSQHEGSDVQVAAGLAAAVPRWAWVSVGSCPGQAGGQAGNDVGLDYCRELSCSATPGMNMGMPHTLCISGEEQVLLTCTAWLSTITLIQGKTN